MIDAHVGQGHQRGALGVLDALDHRFALADGLVGHDAVKGGDGDGQVEQILVGSAGWRPGSAGVRAAESVCALAWLSCATAWATRGHIGVIGGLLGVEVLLGHDAGLVEGLGALPVQALLLQIGLGVLDVGLGGLFRGNIGGDVGLGGGDGGLLAGDIGFLLHVLDGGDRLALLHHVALFHVEVGDAAHGGGAEVDVGLGLDLAGAADHRGQILPHDLGGQNLGVAGLLLVDE